MLPLAATGTDNAGRFSIANVFIIDCHHYGVAMAAAFDFSTIDNVEVWAPTSGVTPSALLRLGMSEFVQRIFLRLISIVNFL